MRLRFKGMDSSKVNYRLKTPEYSSHSSTLEPGQNTSVSWTVIPTFDFRLTRTLIQNVAHSFNVQSIMCNVFNFKAIVGLSFEIGGKRKWQEARSSSFQIEPAETLRTIVMIYPNVSNKLSVNMNPFSVRISVLNIGFVAFNQINALLRV